MADATTIARESCGAFWQVTAWPGTIGAVSSRLADITGIAAPGPGEIAHTGAVQVARVGPLVWWIIGADGALPDVDTALRSAPSRRPWRII